MKFALVLLLSLSWSVSAFAAEKKTSAKGKTSSKPAAKTAAKRGPASEAKPTASAPAAAAPKRTPSSYSTFRFEERVVADKTVLCGVSDSPYGNSVSCVVVNGVAH